MRAAAILFVVGSHVLWVFPETEGPIVSLLRLMGVMGVEIFFVLSGFLIGRILFKIFTSESFKPKDLGYFLVRRWFRTLPNYYLMLLVNILLVLYIGRSLPDSLPSYFFFLQNLESGMDIFFTESWSLPIEEIAYILGPLLLYLVLLPNTGIDRSKLFLGVTLFIILSFLATKVIYNMQHSGTTLDFWNVELKAVVLYRIDAIYYGVLAAFLSVRYTHFWRSIAIGSLLFGVLGFILMHYWIAVQGVTAAGNPFFINVAYLPLCSIFIATSLPFLSRLNRVQTWILKPITFISLISYSMYLLHYSIVLQLMRFFFPTSEMITAEKWGYALLYLVLTIVLSYILYRIYEKPMMDLRDSAFFRRKFQQK